MENKKRTDYTKSAVNLCNPEQIKGMLQYLSEITKGKVELEGKIQALIPQVLKDTLTEAEKEIMQVQNDINLAINEHGSYQDLEAGLYAVKQRKVSKSYDASLFETAYPQFAPAVIIKAVDTGKLAGLIKGGLLDEAQLKAGGIIQEKETFSYIIKCEG
jgi:hypothetical protein